MSYIRETLDLPPFALNASAFALFTLGILAGGATLGGIVLVVAAIARELVLHWIGGSHR